MKRRLLIHDVATVDLLVAALTTSGDVRRRANAARAIAHLGLLGRHAAYALAVGLRDPEQVVRFQCARALAAIGPAAASAIGPLSQALHDRDAGVRTAASMALSTLSAAMHQSSAEAPSSAGASRTGLRGRR